MDTYFFDNPLKAIIKGGFLLFTYISSILFKHFTIAVVLPTVLVYFLSNLSDYAELAFLRVDKVKTIRLWSLVIFVGMLIASIITLALYSVDNQDIIVWVEKYYWIFYVVCAFVWALPMCDGIRGQRDMIHNSSSFVENQAMSNIGYNVMMGATYNKNVDLVSENKDKNMQ